MSDIVDQTQAAAGIPQEQAANNVASANLLSVPPDYYAENKDTFKPIVQQSQMPSDAAPIVAQTMSQSAQHAAAIAPDANHLSWIDGELKSVARGFTKPFNDPAQTRRDIYSRQMANGGTLSDNDQMDLMSLNDQLSHTDEPDFGLKNSWEKIPEKIAGVVGDMGALAVRQRDTMGAVLAAYTGVGAVAGGLAGGGEGAVTEGARGFAKGIGPAFVAGMVKDSYENTSAEMYGQLSNLTGDDGKPLNLDEGTKAGIARGMGTIAASLNVAVGAVGLNNIPFVKQLFQKGGAELLAKNPVLSNAVVSLGTRAAQYATTAGAFGAAGGMQTFAGQIATELAKTKDSNNELSFTNAILNADKNFIANKPQMSPGFADVGPQPIPGTGPADEFFDSLKKGVVGGLLVHGVGEVMHAGSLGAVKGLRDYLRRDAGGAAMERDVTPLQLNAGESSVGEPNTAAVSPEPPPTDSDMHPDLAKNPLNQVNNVLKFQDAVDATSAVAKETALYKHAPEQVSEMRGKMLEDAGIKNLFLDKDEANEFVAEGKTPAEQDARQARLRAAIDPKGQGDAAMNAPIALDPRKALDIHDEFDGFSKFIKLDPEGPSANSTKSWLEQHEANKSAQLQTLQDAGAPVKTLEETKAIQSDLENLDKDPTERAYAMPAITDVKGLDQIQTKEEGQAYLQRLDDEATGELTEAQQKTANNARKAVTIRMANLPSDADRKVDLQNQLKNPDEETIAATAKDLNPEPPANDVWNEPDYLKQDNLTKAIGDVTPDARAAKIDGDLLEGRKLAAAAINEGGARELQQMRDLYAEMHTEGIRQQELDNIANDPNMKVVEDFLDHTKGSDHLSMRIDPKSLAPDLYSTYRKSEVLKMRKVFKKGGMPVDHVAKLLGANTPETLLQILQTTPTRSEFAEMRIAIRQKEIEHNAKRSVDMDYGAINDAFHKKTEAYLDTLKFFKDKKWSGMAKAIHTIALPVPSRGELKEQATKTVEATRLGDLNVNQYKTGERKSNSIAIKKLTKGDVLNAFINKRAAALNNEMQLATMKGIGLSNRLVDTVKEAASKETQQMLVKAGATFKNAMDAILDHYLLDPAKVGTSKADAYSKLLKKQVEAGVGYFPINEAPPSPKGSYNDLTVQQARILQRRMRMIIHSAKIQLDLKAGQAKAEMDARALSVIAQPHPDYDIRRTTKALNSKQMSGYDRIKFAFMDNKIVASLSSVEQILLSADNGLVGGEYHKQIVVPLKEGMAARSADRIDQYKFFKGLVADLREQDRGELENRVKDKTGLDKSAVNLDPWNQLRRKYVQVGDWSTNHLLGGGNVNLSELFMMSLHLGDEEATTALTKGYGITEEQVRDAVEKHLPSHYIEAGQKIKDFIKEKYWPRVQEMQTRTEGEIPQQVPAVPHTLGGKQLAGGYWRIQRLSGFDVEAQRKQIKEYEQLATGGKLTKLNKESYYAEDMTSHGHTEQRVGGEGPVSLDIHTVGLVMDAISHDLAFRERISDALKFLNYKTSTPDATTGESKEISVAHDLAAKVGMNDKNVVMNNIVQLASSSLMKEYSIAQTGQLFERFLAHNQRVQSVGLLVGNLGSIAIQPLSMLYATERMGPTGAKHMAAVVGAVARNPMLAKEMIGSLMDSTSEILPTFKQAAIEGISEHSNNQISQFLGTKQGLLERGTEVFNKDLADLVGKGVQPLEAIAQVMEKRGFQALGMVDEMMKVLVSNAAKRQFLAGDAAGYEQAKLDKMTPAEREKQSNIYAGSTVRLSLTSGDELDKAAIQHTSILKAFAPFFNDSRNIIGTHMRQLREFRQNSEEAKQQFQQGNIKKGFSAGGRAARVAIGLWILTTLADYYQDTKMGLATPDLDDPGAIADYALYAPPRFILGEFPFGREVTFAAQQFLDFGHKSVPTPLAMKPLKSAYDTYIMVAQFLDDHDSEHFTSQQGAKVLATDFAYMVRPIPFNNAFKYFKQASDLTPGELPGASLITSVQAHIKTFLQKQSEMPEAQRVPPEIQEELRKLEGKGSQASIDK